VILLIFIRRGERISDSVEMHLLWHSFDVEVRLVTQGRFIMERVHRNGNFVAECVVSWEFFRIVNERNFRTGGLVGQCGIKAVSSNSFISTNDKGIIPLQSWGENLLVILLE